MKKLFLNSVVFAAAALSIGAACAQTPPAAAADAPVARTIMANTGLCDWFRADDRLAWEVVTEQVSANWEAAVNDIAAAYKLSQDDASRKLVQMCRQQLAQK
jgi:hypothetical protein